MPSQSYFACYVTAYRMVCTPFYSSTASTHLITCTSCVMYTLLHTHNRAGGSASTKQSSRDVHNKHQHHHLMHHIKAHTFSRTTRALLTQSKSSSSSSPAPPAPASTPRPHTSHASSTSFPPSRYPSGPKVNRDGKFVFLRKGAAADRPRTSRARPSSSARGSQTARPSSSSSSTASPSSSHSLFHTHTQTLSALHSAQAGDRPQRRRPSANRESGGGRAGQREQEFDIRDLNLRPNDVSYFTNYKKLAQKYKDAYASAYDTHSTRTRARKIKQNKNDRGTHNSSAAGCAERDEGLRQDIPLLLSKEDEVAILHNQHSTGMGTYVMRWWKIGFVMNGPRERSQLGECSFLKSNLAGGESGEGMAAGLCVV